MSQFNFPQPSRVPCLNFETKTIVLLFLLSFPLPLLPPLSFIFCLFPYYKPQGQSAQPFKNDRRKQNGVREKNEKEGGTEHQMNTGAFWGIAWIKE